MASFRPLAFDLEAKEICPPSTSSNSQQELLPDLTVLPFFDNNGSSHFKDQKWNRVIELSWIDATLTQELPILQILTYLLA